MSHPTEGELRAFLDGETAEGRDARIREHLTDCSDCRRVRDALIRNQALVGKALARLDGEPDLRRARRAVEERLADRPVDRGSRGDGSGWRWPELLRAAALAIVLLGGVSAALPGSPVNAWLLRTLGQDAPAASGASGDDAGGTRGGQGPSAASEPADDVGIRIEPRDGTIRVELTQVSPGTRVEIVLVADERAGISAPRAESFRSGSGVVGVTAPGDLVTIELPRSVPTAEVWSGGRILLRKDRSSLEFPTIMPESDAGAFILTIPATDSVGDG